MDATTAENSQNYKSVNEWKKGGLQRTAITCNFYLINSLASDGKFQVLFALRARAFPPALRDVCEWKIDWLDDSFH